MIDWLNLIILLLRLPRLLFRLMESPVITIVIPFKNRAEYLYDTLRSVANQPYRPLSIILVDNDSEDDSWDVCQRFKAEHATDTDLNVVLTREMKRGAAAARNKGLSLCQTEFVYFFDSDDWFDEDFLFSVLPHLHADIDLLAVPTRMVIDGKEHVRQFYNSTSPVLQVLCAHLNTQSMVFRTEFLRKIGGWNETSLVWNDYELGIRVLMAQPRMRWLTERPFHRILIHDDSITGANFSSRVHALCHTLALIASYSRGNDSLHRAVYYRFAIFYGLLKREYRRNVQHDKSAVLFCHNTMQETFRSVTGVDRCLAWFLSTYTAWGGRGTWRIALMFVKAKRQN